MLRILSLAAISLFSVQLAFAKPVTLLMLGDSLTAGLGLEPQDAFPAKLEAALKPRYPDLTIGAAAIDRGSNGPAGFMVWIGAKVPLQWGAVTARRQEAEATAGAMRARQDARAQLLLGELTQALAVLWKSIVSGMRFFP